RLPQEVARGPRGQGPRTGDAPPADLPLQRGRGRGRRSGVQRGVLHELPPDSRDARRRAEGVPEPERRSPSVARPRRRGRHRRVVLLPGFAWTFVAFAIILISLVLPVIGSEFGIFDLGTFTPRDPFAYGAVAAATLVGSLIGSLTLGRLSDARGRRFLFQASVLSYSAFTALTALSFNVPSLFLLRMLAGVGLGGLLVIDPAILSEYLPPQHRGRYMVLLDFFWPAGFLVAIAFWYVFVIQLGGAWRLLFVAAAFPAFIAFLFRRTIPESPFYLARQGRLQEASSVLRTVA